MSCANTTTSYSTVHRAARFSLSRCAFAFAAVTLLACDGARLDAQSEEGDRYLGREIADVMSFRGAAWLERAERETEENSTKLLGLLPIEQGDTVVDMGCGSGYYARRMAAMVGERGTVLCVDIQPQMLEIAKQLAQRDGLDNIDYILGEVDNPNLPEGSVDLILLVDVYHEFAQPAPMLDAMRRALRPGGTAALAEYRLEGESATWIKVDHRMSTEQVNKEWLPAGFALQKLHESLPSQHLFLFSPAAASEP